MNIKKYVLAIIATVLSVGSFAYPVPQDEDSSQQLLQQYAAKVEELQKSFDKELLPPVKQLAQFVLAAQSSGQEELTVEQEQALEQHVARLDAALNKLVAPALKEVDIEQFNQQYNQIASSYGMPQEELTLENVAELFKGIYLTSALVYFEQNKKLTQDEISVLTAILLPQEDEQE